MKAPKTKDLEVAAPNDDERTSAIGLTRYAYEYLEAAMVVDEHCGAAPQYSHISPTPAYYLLSHSVELTLKSYLRHCGITVKQLSSREYGHDLNASYQKAKELGLQNLFHPTEDDTRALAMLVAINESHELRYIRTGLKEFPSWAIVEPFAVRLHQAVSPHVGYKSFTTAYPATPETARRPYISDVPRRVPR